MQCGQQRVALRLRRERALDGVAHASFAVDHPVSYTHLGSAALTTVQGETLTVRSANGGVTVTDAKGNVAKVTIADVQQKNGVIHVVDKVLMP